MKKGNTKRAVSSRSYATPAHQNQTIVLFIIAFVLLAALSIVYIPGSVGHAFFTTYSCKENATQAAIYKSTGGIYGTPYLNVCTSSTQLAQNYCKTTSSKFNPSNLVGQRSVICQSGYQCVTNQCVLSQPSPPTCIDADQDGYGLNCALGNDCNDNIAIVHPGATEICNTIDDNCDSQVDEGLTNACGTCGPLPTEVCDGFDNNCDGQIDEGVLNACGTCGPVPTEVCDGIDNDCDSAIDDGLPTVTCTNYNTCQTYTTCNTCPTAPAEQCGDALDNDCDGSIDEGCLASEGNFLVSSCANKDGTGPAKCYWQYKLNPTSCMNKGCDKLVIFFSGGGMMCNSTNNILTMNAFVNDGYIAVCGQTFYTGLGSQSYPYVKESGRVNELITNVVSSSVIQQAWSGKYLLHSGISHGATAPVVAMARGNNDSENPAWKGSIKTGACYFEGIYNSSAELNFLTVNNCLANKTPDVPILPLQTYLTRYCGSSQLCPDFAEKSADDTIVGVDPSAFSIQNWKLISCGSKTLGYFCALDVVPAAQIQQLCSSLDASNQTCVYKDFAAPTYTHVNCAQTKPDECYSWFDALIAQP